MHQSNYQQKNDYYQIPKRKHCTQKAAGGVFRYSSNTVNHTAEIQNRIAMAIKTCAQLKLFWDRADTSISWKLRVFNSTIKSTLMYGLETIQLTQGEHNKIDAFQMKNSQNPADIHRAITDKPISQRSSNEIRSQYWKNFGNLEAAKTETTRTYPLR